MATNQTVADRLAKSVTEMHNIVKNLSTPATNILPVPVIRDLKGSHFQVLHPSTHIMQTMPLATANLFFPLGIAISYRTNIAKTVWNLKYNKPELWITPNRYSNTTARHKSLIIGAFNRACMAIGMTYDEARASTYETLALSDSIEDRVVNEIEHVIRHGGDYKSALHDAVRGGIHVNTRIAHVQSALANTSNSFDRLTRDVPVGNTLERMQTGTIPHSLLEIYEQTARSMVERIDFMNHLLTLPINEMRVVIRAQLELDKE